MASHATAYRKSPASESGNSNRPPTPFSRVAQVRNSSLPYWQRDKLASLMAKFNATGDDLWMEMESASIVIGRVSTRRERISRRALHYLFSSLTAAGVLRIKARAGSWMECQDERGNFQRKKRRTTSYALMPEKLTPRETYQQWVEAGKPRLERGVKAPEKPREESVPPQAMPSTTSAPPVQTGHRPAILDARRGVDPNLSPERKLTRDEKLAFANIYVRNRRRMIHLDALQDACEQMHTSFEVGSLVLKIADSKGSLNGLPCEKHPDSGRTQWGTCWGCYAEQFGYKVDNSSEQPEGP